MLALSPRPWTTEAALALAGPDLDGAVAESLAYLAEGLAPVPTDPEMLKGWKTAMDERLRRLAAKIAPGMPEAPAAVWREVMVDALSDLPAMVSLTAAKRALHKPMKFLNEVEGIVRDIAAMVLAERNHARRRIEDLPLRARRETPALPPQEEGAPFSFDEIKRMSASMRRLGVSTGAFTQEQLDEVEKAEAVSQQPCEAHR
jgi:hypothetical protein